MLQNLQQLPNWIWIAVIASMLMLAVLVAFRYWRKLSIHWGWTTVAVAAIVIVFVASVLAFPKEWGLSPIAALVLLAIVLREVISTLADLRSLISKERAKPQPSSETGSSVTVSVDKAQLIQAPNGRAIQADQYLEIKGDYYAAPPSQTSLSGSALPPRRAFKFVDRGPIMDELRQALKANTAAAIVGVGGMGGVGKTELARFLAGEFSPDVVIWVFVGDRPVSQVQGELARALGIQLPPNADDEGRAGTLRAAFVQAPRVVFLDDIRQGFPLALCLPPSPPCAALLTSRLRELPDLRSGAVKLLDVMTEAQAMELLQSVGGLAEAVPHETEAAKTLCKLCAHHPLALDLASRRLLRQLRGVTPIASFNAALKDKLAQLKIGKGPLENLTANFDLSYEALDGADQVRFRKLAVFAPAGFAPQAAAAVWGDDEVETGEVLYRLENVSLLMPALSIVEGPALSAVEGPAELPEGLRSTPEQSGGVEPSGSYRYRLHDLLREYAADKLGAGEEAVAAHRAHAEFLIALFDKHYTDDLSTAPHVAFEFDNLLLTAEWATAKGDGNLLALLATKPRNWLTVLNLRQDWEMWLNSALKIGIEDQGLQANVLQAIGDVQQFRDDRDAALVSYEEALRLFRSVGAKLGEANARMSLGDFHLAQNQWAEAIQHYEYALPVYRAIGAKLSQANTLIDIGKAYFETGERERGMACVKEAGNLFAQIGSGYWAIKAYRRLAEMLKQSGRAAEAEQIEEQLKKLEGG